MSSNLVSAKVICDSIPTYATSISHRRYKRLTTLEVTMHRFILAEFNTHRVFSRNSASSRAIPVQKIIQRITDAPAIPVHWGLNQKGMRADQELSTADAARAQGLWLEARDNAINSVRELIALGVHKQVANRLLEPFMYHVAVVTATEWENFFAQRIHPDAQPEMQLLASKIKEAYDASTPVVLEPWEYHLPYITSADLEVYSKSDHILCKLSAARCARTSYLTHDGVRDTSADVDLFNRLRNQKPPHASPFEHVARPRDPGESKTGNLVGWKQYRHVLQMDEFPYEH